MEHLTADRSAAGGPSRATNHDSIFPRFLTSALLLCLLLSLLPTAIADDDWNTANVLTDGSSSSDALGPIIGRVRCKSGILKMSMV